MTISEEFRLNAPQVDVAESEMRNHTGETSGETSGIDNGGSTTNPHHNLNGVHRQHHHQNPQQYNNNGISTDQHGDENSSLSTKENDFDFDASSITINEDELNAPCPPPISPADPQPIHPHQQQRHHQNHHHRMLSSRNGTLSERNKGFHRSLRDIEKETAPLRRLGSPIPQRISTHQHQQDTPAPQPPPPSSRGNIGVTGPRSSSQKNVSLSGSNRSSSVSNHNYRGGPTNPLSSSNNALSIARPVPLMKFSATSNTTEKQRGGVDDGYGDDLDDDEERPYGSMRNSGRKFTNGRGGAGAYYDDDDDDDDDAAGYGYDYNNSYGRHNFRIPDEERVVVTQQRVLLRLGFVVMLLLAGGLVAILMLTIRNNTDDDFLPDAPPSATTTTSPDDGTGNSNDVSGEISDTNDDGDNTSNNNDVDDTGDGSVVMSPTLQNIIERGYLRCGVSPASPGLSTFNEKTGVQEGFDVDLCRAVAAAIFGTDIDTVDIITLLTYDRFTSLRDDEVDMLARGTTHTMERSIYEPRSQDGFQFSIPYLYNGLKFAGQPGHVACAESFTSLGTCGDTVICVTDSTTHTEIILSLNQNARFTTSLESATSMSKFVDGLCNVVAAEQFGLAESLIRDLGYTGEYVLGSKVISKEPLAIVTRKDDKTWSDFVNWVVEGLLYAEDQGITKETAAAKMKQTNVFGIEHRDMFRHSIRTVGNYGDLFSRWLEPLVPRPRTDQINDGMSGLVYSLPFGSLHHDIDNLPDPSIVNPINDGTIQRIMNNGHLKCGIINHPAFVQFDPVSQQWSGFYIEFCRAIAAALFDGSDSEIEIESFVNENDAYDMLQHSNSDVDLVIGMTNTFRSDTAEVSTKRGYSFTQPIYYDGLTFAGIDTYVKCADSLDANSVPCRGLTICTNETYEDRLRHMFPERVIVIVDGPILIDSINNNEFNNGGCNVIAGLSDDVHISAARRREATYNELFVSPSTSTSSYAVGLHRFTPNAKTIATRQDDHQWVQFVYWIISAILYADEQTIYKATAQDRLPEVHFFGPTYTDMFRRAVTSSGSYSEIYNNHLEMELPRGGPNLVNVLLSGPQHYPKLTF